MYVYVYVCMYVCMYVYIYIYIFFKIKSNKVFLDRFENHGTKGSVKSV